MKRSKSEVKLNLFWILLKLVCLMSRGLCTAHFKVVFSLFTGRQGQFSGMLEEPSQSEWPPDLFQGYSANGVIVWAPGWERVARRPVGSGRRPWRLPETPSLLSGDLQPEPEDRRVGPHAAVRWGRHVNNGPVGGVRSFMPAVIWCHPMMSQI